MKGSVYPRPYEKDPVTGARRAVRGSTWTYQFARVKADGDRRYVTKGGYRTRKEAEAALAEALTEHGQSPTAPVEPSKMALATFLTDEWLPTLNGLKPTTRRNYKDLVDAYLAPHLGDEPLRDLTPGRIAKFYDLLRTSGRRRQSEDGPKGLSESSVHHVHVALSAAMTYAVESGALRTSPVAALPRSARPKVNSSQRPEMTVWSAEECRGFLASAIDDRLAPVFDLALNTGMRRGELVGLRWADVDLDGSMIAVRRNRVVVGYAAEEGTPKGNRARTIDIDTGTVAVLKAHRKRQLEERLAVGGAWTETGLVFTRENGTALHPQTLLWHLRKLSKAAGVPAIRLHDLRHTHATLGLAAGVPVKVMQERLGHSSVAITMDLYSHVIPGMQADAAAKIGGLLRPVVGS